MSEEVKESKEPCDHESFEYSANPYTFTARSGNPVCRGIVLSVSCGKCGAPFSFQGLSIDGINNIQPTMSMPNKKFAFLPLFPPEIDSPIMNDEIPEHLN